MSITAVRVRQGVEGALGPWPDRGRRQFVESASFRPISHEVKIPGLADQGMGEVFESAYSVETTRKDQRLVADVEETEK
ncbi:hypothetical protein [Pseudomonas sp. S31]|uniref:hypothetical protein n=1 Tax=Pseudomonas sp. S31 TaxID=1564473 RepID=UPI001914ACAE|nr:hypothetical protein [Pseudomonas sp. S31]